MLGALLVGRLKVAPTGSAFLGQKAWPLERPPPRGTDDGLVDPRARRSTVRRRPRAANFPCTTSLAWRRRFPPQFLAGLAPWIAHPRGPTPQTAPSQRDRSGAGSRDAALAKPRDPRRIPIARADRPRDSRRRHPVAPSRRGKDRNRKTSAKKGNGRRKGRGERRLPRRLRIGRRSAVKKMRRCFAAALHADETCAQTRGPPVHCSGLRAPPRATSPLHAKIARGGTSAPIHNDRKRGARRTGAERREKRPRGKATPQVATGAPTSAPGPAPSDKRESLLVPAELQALAAEREEKRKAVSGKRKGISGRTSPRSGDPSPCTGPRWPPRVALTPVPCAPRRAHGSRR